MKIYLTMNEVFNLYGFQKEVLKQSYKENRVAYYYDMGLGKTFIGSEKLKMLGASCNLVICQKSKVADWVNHFTKYYNYKIFDLTREEGKNFNFSQNSVNIINYELIFRRPYLTKLNKHDWTLLLDESSLIQNPTAKRTKYILKVLMPKNVILLSGCPVDGKYENLWSQLVLLGYNWSQKEFFEFYAKYYEMPQGRFTIKIPYGYKNVDKLKTLMKFYNCYFKKTEEVIELPPQNFIDVNCKPNPKYKEFIKNKLANVNGEMIVGDNLFNYFLGARKLSGYLSENKKERLQELLESSNSRFIAYYSYNAEKEVIKEICQKLKKPISEINGEVKDLTNYEKESNSVTLCQYQAGAMGLNLQKSNKIIYFSPTPSSELFEQSKKRIHRIGQSEPCFYYLLKCGIDSKIYASLQKKENYTNELFRRDFE